MAWKLAALVFQGSSNEAKSLVGKKIRVRVPMICPTVDLAKPDLQGATINLRVGQEGFLGHAPLDAPAGTLTVAFSKPGVVAANFEQLQRKAFNAVRMNTVTFRNNFEIDI
jgi:hypothetical protein